MKIVDFVPDYTAAVDALEDGCGQRIPIAKRHNSGHIIKVAVNDKEVIGTAYGRMKGDLLIIEGTAVKEGERGKGIGTMLTQNVLEHAKSLGARNAVAGCLVKDGNLPLDGIMKRLDFKEIFRVKGYWSDTNADCDVCGGKPCDCTCAMFARGL